MKILNLTLTQTQSWQEIYQVSEDRFRELIAKYNEATGFEEQVDLNDHQRMQLLMEVLFQNGYLSDDDTVKNPNADVEYNIEVDDFSMWEDEE